MAPGHHAEGRRAGTGKLVEREDIELIAQAAVLVGVNPETLLTSTNPDLVLALQAIAVKAEKFRLDLDTRLASLIINKLGESMK